MPYPPSSRNKPWQTYYKLAYINLLLTIFLLMKNLGFLVNKFLLIKINVEKPCEGHTLTLDMPRLRWCHVELNITLNKTTSHAHFVLLFTSRLRYSIRWVCIQHSHVHETLDID